MYLWECAAMLDEDVRADDAVPDATRRFRELQREHAAMGARPRPVPSVAPTSESPVPSAAPSAAPANPLGLRLRGVD